MKNTKKMVLAIFAFITLLSANLSAAPALIWGYFTDVDQIMIDGVVDAESIGYQDDTAAGGSYMIYLPAGSYTLTASSNGYVTEEIPLVVEDDQTYQVDFALQPE